MAAGALPGNSALTHAFVQQHCKQLEGELQRRREAARVVVERARSSDLPVTQQQWISWFGEHEDEFRARMAAAWGQAEGGQPSVDSSSLVARLSRDRPKVKADRLAQWQQLRWGRTGWFCLQMEQGCTAMLFVVAHNMRTYCVDLSHKRRGQEYRFCAGESLGH